MLKPCTKDVMKIIEEQTYPYYEKMGRRKSEFLMKTHPQRVLDDFEKYKNTIDLSVVAKYMNKKDIKAFLYKYSNTLDIYKDYNLLTHFIKNMEQNERVELVQKCFINQTEMLFNKKDMKWINSLVRTYEWYELIPYDLAFLEIKNLILKENSPSEQCDMLSVLITSAKTNTKHIKSFLTFLMEIHMNIPFKYKIEFVNNLLTNVSTHELDEATWNLLDQIFHSMDVYIDTENDVQLCLESIIVRKVLNDEAVPEVIEQKCSFGSFKNIVLSLNEEQKNKLFIYALNSLVSKVNTENIVNKSDFDGILDKLQRVLILLNDWNKQLSDYPFIYETIKTLIKTKGENEWTTDLSCLYKVNKSWRKYMFEESLSLSLCEETCLNALKHKPQLLTRHDKQIHTLRTDDAVSLRRVLAKLRVYWPDSLARHWTEAYMQSLNELTGHKAIVEGLFMLLSQSQVIDLARKYVNDNFKINCNLTDQTEFSIRKNIAKQLHVARPLVPLDTVYWYTKGEYAKYAVQSHSAILSNLGEVDSREYLLKLRNVPVVLLKFVLNQAFAKLKISEVKNVFSNIWKSAKDPTSRSVIYEYIFNRISYFFNEKFQDDEYLWEILNICLDDLSVEGESTNIYEKLMDIDKVPYSKQALYYMKSYRYLASLPDELGCAKYVNELFNCANKIIGELDNDFIVNIVLSSIKIQFGSSMFCDSLAMFVLYCDSEENQLQRYKKIEPAIEETFKNWKTLASYRQNFILFLDALAHFLVTDYSKKIPIPVKLFTELQNKMQNCLSVLENYEMHTSWKLLIEYIKLLSELCVRQKDNRPYNYWKVASFGPILLEYLKEDVDKYSPMIHNMFATALDKMFKMLWLRDYIIVDHLRLMLNEDFDPAYLVVSKIMPQYTSHKTKYLQTQILKKFKSNLSKSVQVQFYNELLKYPEVHKLFMSI
ncbi:uncharacterized protein LOC126911214 [Spodoptera frugiperda]|uniref:Uncharacterized protein LOC126911214 n=1 Tax=Spodoptera frugiperda TaxID=7108 RepID=A0A9R0DTG6_SPOFR|nr:uncharacterized protein LOC126911214 [Spodoptera frugiperda]